MLLVVGQGRRNKPRVECVGVVFSGGRIPQPCRVIPHSGKVGGGHRSMVTHKESECIAILLHGKGRTPSPLPRL